MVLAIDFDNTIHDCNNRPASQKMGEPLPGAYEAVWSLWKQAHRIIIHTVMATSESGKQAVIDWLKYYDIPFNDVTATKPNADVYIDDKALRFTNWKDTLDELYSLQNK